MGRQGWSACVRGLRLLPGLCCMLVLSGCMAYRYTPALAPALSAKGQQLAANAHQSFRYDTPKYSRMLKESTLGGKQVRYDLAFELKEKYPNWPQGFQCFEPFLLVWTLGIVPAVCEQETQVSVAMHDRQSGQVSTRDLTFQSKSIWGWASLFFLPSSLWSTRSDGEQMAVYTLVNALAEETAGDAAEAPARQP